MIYLPSFSEILAVSQSRGEDSAAPHLWKGLVGAWTMQEGGGLTAFDVSGNGNHGTLAQADQKTKWTTSNKGRALDFDGVDDYVVMGDIDAVDGVSQLTISAWARLDDVSNDNYAGVISKEASSNSRFAMSQGPLNGNGNDVFISFANGSDTYGYTTDSWLVEGQWHLWTMVFDGSGAGDSDRLKFYADGQLKTLTFNGPIPATTVSNSAAVAIGAMEQGSENFWDGAIDDVRIYDRALTAPEIKQLYSDPWAAYRPRRRVFKAPAAAGTPDGIQSGVIMRPVIAR